MQKIFFNFFNMADWNDINEKGNVEDRRGMKMAGGIGLFGLLIILAVGYFQGTEPALQLMDQMNNQTISYNQEIDKSKFKGEDSYEKFIGKIMGSEDKLWGKSFKQSGIKFEKPKLVLFRGLTKSACGGASSQAGPHYCPLDKTIYLDETFFQEMKQEFGAKGGDVAQAYVVAHEYGHHIQNLLGITQKVRSNIDSIKLELQADCFAGIWLGSIKNIFDNPNEIFEAIDAASSVGDDRIQKKMTGHISPETWTHGSSKQRKYWLSIGYKYGSFTKCNTFAN